MLRVLCGIFVVASLLLSSSLFAGQTKPFLVEDFEKYPMAVSDSESFTGKCLSIDSTGYSVKVDNPRFRKTGSICFWCKGADPRTALNDIVAMRSSTDTNALFSFYSGINAGGFLDYLCKIDKFMGDPLDWHSFIISWDEKYAAFYFDGVPMMKESANSSPAYERIREKIDDKFDTFLFRQAKGVLIDRVELFDSMLGDAGARQVYAAVASRAKYKTVTLVPVVSMHPTAEERTDFSKEPWFGFNKGIDHGVPAPWTPIIATDESFKCWGREYCFDSFGISSMTSGSDKILSGPARIFVVNEKGKKFIPIATSTPVLASEFPDRADYSVSATWGSIEIHQSISAEFDGFVKYTITVKPKKPVLISGLGVELPISAPFSKYMNIFGSFSSYLYSPLRCPDLKKGQDFWWRFEPYIIAENEDKGLCFMVESEKNCHWADRSKVVGFVEDGNGGRKMIFNFINCNTFIDPKVVGDGIIYEFAVQALPVRPMLRDYRNYRVSAKIDEPGVDKRNTVIPGIPWFWHNPWPSFHEFDDQLSTSIEVVKGAEARGRIKKGFVAPYMNFQKYGCEAVGVPMKPYAAYRSIWNMSAVGDGLGYVPTTTYPVEVQSQLNTACDYGKYQPGRDLSSKIMEVCEGSKTFNDFFIWEFCQLMSRFPDLNGIYLDETFSYGCSSEAHGCGWHTAKGSVLGKYPIFANREARKRWYKVARSYHQDYLFWTHDSAFIKPPQMAYSDFTSSGETIGYDSGDPLDTIDLREFRIEYLGKQVGVPQFLLPEVHRENEETPTRKLATLLLLHDTYIWNLWTNRKAVDQIWALANDFCLDDDTRFIPYWSDKPYARSSRIDVLCSAYVKKDRAMVVMYNIGKQRSDAELRIGDPLDISIVHPMETKVLSRHPGKCVVRLEPSECAVVVFSK